MNLGKIKRAEKGQETGTLGSKNENLAKCLVEGVYAHPGCCKKIDLSPENRAL
jgi:hypothetical protein